METMEDKFHESHIEEQQKKDDDHVLNYENEETQSEPIKKHQHFANDNHDENLMCDFKSDSVESTRTETTFQNHHQDNEQEDEDKSVQIDKEGKSVIINSNQESTNHHQHSQFWSKQGFSVPKNLISEVKSQFDKIYHQVNQVFSTKTERKNRVKNAILVNRLKKRQQQQVIEKKSQQSNGNEIIESDNTILLNTNQVGKTHTQDLSFWNHVTPKFISRKSTNMISSSSTLTTLTPAAAIFSPSSFLSSFKRLPPHSPDLLQSSPVGSSIGVDSTRIEKLETELALLHRKVTGLQKSAEKSFMNATQQPMVSSHQGFIPPPPPPPPVGLVMPLPTIESNHENKIPNSIVDSVKSRKSFTICSPIGMPSFISVKGKDGLHETAHVPIMKALLDEMKQVKLKRVFLGGKGDKDEKIFKSPRAMRIRQFSSMQNENTRYKEQNKGKEGEQEDEFNKMDENDIPIMTNDKNTAPVENLEKNSIMNKDSFSFHFKKRKFGSTLFGNGHHSSMVTNNRRNEEESNECNYNNRVSFSGDQNDQSKRIKFYIK